MTSINPPSGWVLPSEVVWEDFNKTQTLLFHSLSLSSGGCDFALHAEICHVIPVKSQRAEEGAWRSEISDHIDVCIRVSALPQ